MSSSCAHELVRTWLCRLVLGRHLWKKQVSATHHRDSSDTSPREMIRDENLVYPGRPGVICKPRPSAEGPTDQRHASCHFSDSLLSTSLLERIAVSSSPLFFTLASPSRHCESSFHLQSWTRCFSAAPMGRKWILWRHVFSRPHTFVPLLRWDHFSPQLLIGELHTFALSWSVLS